MTPSPPSTELMAATPLLVSAAVLRDQKGERHVVQKKGWSLSSHWLWALARGICATRGLGGEKAWLNPSVCMVFR